MAKQLLGKEVNAALNARIIADCEACKAKGVNPTMAIVRCGERPDDLSYERTALLGGEVRAAGGREQGGASQGY